MSSSLSSHPISERDQQCSVSIKNEYTVLFEKVENDLFKPLVKVISCNCSILQKPITLSNAEIQTFKKGHITTSNINMKPPILIYKDKTYLSQLFEKTCILFYKPVEIKESVHNNTFSTLIQNIRIQKNNCSAYAHGNLSVFSTPIQSDTDKSNIPVFFIENDKVDVDYSPEKSFEFFKYIAQELIDLKVFVPIKNKDTYELNNDFDIETLDCYKNFPDAAKSEVLKKRVTKYFYFFIGNIFHLFVTNHIEVPFKLTLYYGLRLFNLVDVVSSTTNQLILVSIYFLEKAKPEFVKEIIKILEDPKHLLKTKFFKIEDAAVGVRMNGYLTVVSEQENRPLYSEEEYVLVNNIIEFLFRNAITDCFPNAVYNFFNGFNFTMNFDDSTKLYKQRTLPAPNYLFTHQKILEQIVKANKYMCE